MTTELLATAAVRGEGVCGVCPSSKCDGEHTRPDLWAAYFRILGQWKVEGKWRVQMNGRNGERYGAIRRFIREIEDSDKLLQQIFGKRSADDAPDLNVSCPGCEQCTGVDESYEKMVADLTPADEGREIQAREDWVSEQRAVESGG